MAKGNWQRRAELAAARREEKRQAKDARKGARVIPQAILTKLLKRDPYAEVWLAQVVQVEEEVEYVRACAPPMPTKPRRRDKKEKRSRKGKGGVWEREQRKKKVAAAESGWSSTGGGSLCAAYLRDQCVAKRCKLSHDHSISHLTIPPPPEAAEADTEGNGEELDSSTSSVPRDRVREGDLEYVAPPWREAHVSEADVAQAHGLASLPSLTLSLIFTLTPDPSLCAMLQCCKELRNLGAVCADVRRRRDLALAPLVRARIKHLVSGGVSIRLRFAGSRGLLAFDWANENAWPAFVLESARRYRRTHRIGGDPKAAEAAREKAREEGGHPVGMEDVSVVEMPWLVIVSFLESVDSERLYAANRACRKATQTAWRWDRQRTRDKKQKKKKKRRQGKGAKKDRTMR